MNAPPWNSLIRRQWIAGGRYVPNVNPSDLNDVIGESVRVSADDVAEAVRGARVALPAWNSLSIQARSKALDRIVTEILARRKALGGLLSRQVGKTKPEGVGEARRASNIFKFFAGDVLRLPGRLLTYFCVRPK